MRLIIFAMTTFILSTNVIADPRVGDPMPSLVQYLYIQGDGDYSFSDEQKKGIFESLYPYFDHKWLEADRGGVETPAGSIFDNNAGLAIVSHGKQSSTLKVLRYIKGIAAVVALDAIEARRIPGAKSYSINSVLNEKLNAKTAEQQIMVLETMRSAAFKAHIKKMTTEERKTAARNLYYAAVGPVNAMAMLEQEMMVAARRLVLAKDEVGYADLEKQARQLLEERSEIKYARQALRKTLKEITEIAYSLRGRTHDAEFFYAGLAHPNSALTEMAQTMPKAVFLAKLNAYFKLVENGIHGQMKAGYDRLQVENLALAEARKTPYVYSEIVEKSPVKLSGRGLYGNHMAAVFQDERKWDMFSYQLFHDDPKWRVLLEFLDSADKDISSFVASRVLKIVSDIEIPMAQLMDKMDKNEVMSRSIDEAHSFQEYMKEKSFDEILADRIIHNRDQEHRIRYDGLNSVMSVMQALFYGATWQVYAPNEAAAALRAENAFRLLLKIKASVRTKQMKDYLAELASIMMNDRKSAIARLAAINPVIGQLASEFSGIKEQSWLRPRNRALVVCDQFIAKK